MLTSFENNLLTHFTSMKQRSGLFKDSFMNEMKQETSFLKLGSDLKDHKLQTRQCILWNNKLTQITIHQFLNLFLLKSLRNFPRSLKRTFRRRKMHLKMKIGSMMNRFNQCNKLASFHLGIQSIKFLLTQRTQTL